MQRIAEGKQKASKKRVKKNVKRVQATKNAVKKAIQILVPLPTVKKEVSLKSLCFVLLKNTK